MLPIDGSQPEDQRNLSPDPSPDQSSDDLPGQSVRHPVPASPVRLLLEWEPWHRAFLRRIAELVRPPRLPPLVVTCQPVPVKALQQYKRNRLATPVSLFFHLVVIAAVVQLGRRAVQVVKQPVVAERAKIFYNVRVPLANDNGGGGGGDRSKDLPSKGNLPKPSLVQLAPPTVVIRNAAPKLPVEPTIIAPPNIQLPQTADILQLGDLWSDGIVPSNGTGGPGGIGTGEGPGVGPGKGPGAGPGENGGCCSGLFHVGKDVSAPQVIFQVEPEYSDQARKAKYQGMVELYVVIQRDGTVRDVRVKAPLGMGLDEKAIDAVKQWRFRPSMRGGEAVDVSAVIEVIFRLL